MKNITKAFSNQMRVVDNKAVQLRARGLIPSLVVFGPYFLLRVLQVYPW